MSRQKRKHYLMLPSYQLRLVAFISAIVFVCSILHGFFLYHIISGNLLQKSYLSTSQVESIWAIIRPALIVANGLNFFIITVLMLVVAVLISHKLVGPMFKAAGHIRKSISGDVDIDELKFRKGDEGVVLCEAINEMNAHYKKKSSELRKIASKIEKKNYTKKQIAQDLEKLASSFKVDANNSEKTTKNS